MNTSLDLTEIGPSNWLASMPACLAPFWPQMSGLHTKRLLQPLQQALSKQFPTTGSRIRALLHWYGAGEGPWSPAPLYESVVEDLLLLNDTHAILSAVGQHPLSEQATEGLARLLAGWYFSQTRPHDLDLVPAKLKRLLLEHCLESEDEDKRARATAAFADPSERLLRSLKRPAARPPANQNRRTPPITGKRRA